MKRLFVLERYKRRLLLKQQDELKRKKIANLKKRERHRERLGVASAKTNKRKDILPEIAVVAPACFSLLEDPDGTIRFLNEIVEGGRSHHLRIDLSGVKQLGPEAIATFVAIVKSLDSKVAGNEPTDPGVRQIMHDSGFFDHFRGVVSENRGRGEIRMESASDRVRSDIAAKLTDFATQQLYGEAMKHGPAYKLFIETMGNTWDHASPYNTVKKTWWASVYYDETKKRACFTVVDRGVGILRSLTFQQRLSLLKRVPFRDNGEKLQSLLLGQIPSRTKEKHRGRGLPDAYASWQEKRIANLVVIANDAYANAEQQSFRQLDEEFSGTIVYWEL